MLRFCLNTLQTLLTAAANIYLKVHGRKGILQTLKIVTLKRKLVLVQSEWHFDRLKSRASHLILNAFCIIQPLLISLIIFQ